MKSSEFYEGREGLPAVLLIHGLGMNKYFWIDPEECSVLGGLAPLTVFLSGSDAESTGRTISFGTVDPDIEGLWRFLKKAGFSLASWSQSQPLGPIRLAVDELRAFLEKVRSRWPGKTIYIIGHSRGGLIARRFLLDEAAPHIAGLATICTPHSGTGMAKFTRFLKPAGVLLEKVLPEKAQAALTKALSRLSLFLQSPAIAELVPESDFMKSLQTSLPDELSKLSIGGTDPRLFQVFIRLGHDRCKVVRFPDLLTDVMPSKRIPEELIRGRGDALVTAESARLAGAAHHDFPVNHVKAAYDAEIHKTVLNFLRS